MTALWVRRSVAATRFPGHRPPDHLVRRRGQLRPPGATPAAGGNSGRRARTERGGYGRDDFGRAIGTLRASSLDHLAKVTAAGAARGDVQDPVGLAGVVDGDDVRMLGRGGRPCFPAEPFAELGVRREDGSEEFQRHRPAELLIGGTEDHGHTTRADPLSQLATRHRLPRGRPFQELVQRPGNAARHEASCLIPA
jgi:hypothetical protein